MEIIKNGLMSNGWGLGIRVRGWGWGDLANNVGTTINFAYL